MANNSQSAKARLSATLELQKKEEESRREEVFKKVEKLRVVRQSVKKSEEDAVAVAQEQELEFAHQQIQAKLGHISSQNQPALEMARRMVEDLEAEHDIIVKETAVLQKMFDGCAERLSEASAKLDFADKSFGALISTLRAEENALVMGGDSKREEQDALLLAKAKKADDMLRTAAAQTKKLAGQRAKMELIERRAKIKETHIKGRVEDGKEFHDVSADAKDIDLAAQSWFQINWTREESEAYLENASKGAFIIRKSADTLAIAIQCGPMVHNKISHIRLNKCNMKGKEWYNVVPTIHYFEHVYDLIFYCHYCPFHITNMSSENVITLSLAAALEAEAALEAKHLEELERVEQDEAAKRALLQASISKEKEKNSVADAQRQEALRIIAEKRKAGFQVFNKYKLQVAKLKQEYKSMQDMVKERDVKKGEKQQAINAARKQMDSMTGEHSSMQREAELIAEAKRKAAERRKNSRAKAVCDYIKAKGIDSDRLFHTGQGDSQPVASNDTEESQSLNRRVEFLIHV